MELLGRVAAVIGISMVLTLLLLVFYQDDKPQFETPMGTQASVREQR